MGEAFKMEDPLWRNRMADESKFQQILKLIRGSLLSFLMSLGLSLVFFFAGYRPEVMRHAAYTRHLAISAIIFVFLFVIFKLFGASVKISVAQEKRDLAAEDVNSRLLHLFIFYKELIKTVVGVSLTLAWLAGLMFIFDHFVTYSFLAKAGMGLGLSVFLFLCSLAFVTVVDQVRYPKKD